MDYFIQVGEERLELSEADAREMLQQAKRPKRTLAEAVPGEIVHIGLRDFLVLEQRDGETAVILKDLMHETVKFGDSNCFEDSFVDEACQRFAEELELAVGAENLLEHTVDLTSDDGLKDYGSVLRKVSLLTAELYRKYVEVLDTCKLKKWWWLATPYSTERHENASWVKCVSPRGRIDGGSCNYGDRNGVRPFCIFKSSIFVS